MLIKKLIIFDLDGTLAESKSAISDQMSELLWLLLEKFSVAIISGGAWKQFETQLLKNLLLEDNLQEKLYIFPTCATSFYQYQNKIWNKIYSEDLTIEEKKSILKAFDNCFKVVNFIKPEKPPFGEILEDRATQITFSALGQSAPLSLKSKWDPTYSKRLQMIESLRVDLPNFEIRSGGTTSIDITRKNIDKAYGIKQITKYLNFKIEEMLFVGDRLEPGGNDSPVISTGVDCVETSGPTQTKTIIKDILAGNKVEIIGKKHK